VLLHWPQLSRGSHSKCRKNTPPKMLHLKKLVGGRGVGRGWLCAKSSKNINTRSKGLKGLGHYI